MIELPYTICFCCYQQHVLMLHRTFPPNAQLWNSLGGKIKTGETPLASVHREMQEEAGLDLRQASSLFFAGIITWGLTGCDSRQGMYAFVAHLSPSQAKRITSLNTPEGLVAWKPLVWVCDPSNEAVVNNIPHFLPPLLKARVPCEYFCEYERENSSTETFRQLVIRPLPAYIVLSGC